ncbi:MAG: tetratricopeptide repeat protein [Chloroflexota bacterium]|nr:tetratricopeptide repeat protein [Chloroflexota bacterium]
MHHFSYTTLCVDQLARAQNRQAVLREERHTDRFEEEKRMTLQGFNQLSTDSATLVEVESLMQIGRFREALQIVEPLLQEQEDCYRAWLLKGEILRQAHQAKEAIEAFQRALEIDPYDDWVIARLAEAYRDLGQSEKALEHVDRALSLNPDSVFALAVKGEILRLMSREREAVRLLDRSLHLNMNRAAAFAQQAEELRQNQQHEESLSCYDNSLTANAHSAWVLASKGKALRSLGELEAALETIDQALELRERHLALLGAKAEMLRKVGRYEDALAVFDRTKEMHQEKSRMVASKAMVLSDLGQMAEADDLLERAIALQPEEAFLWWLRGYLLDREKQVDKACHCLARVIELNPSHAEAVATYARLLWHRGIYDSARQMVRHYFSLREDDWGYFLAALIEICCGNAATGQGLLSRAISQVKDLLEQEPESDVCVRRTFNLALYLLVAGDLEPAAALYRSNSEVASHKQLRDALHDLHFIYHWDVMTARAAPHLVSLRAALETPIRPS